MDYKLQIMSLCGISDYDYSATVFDAGMRYLEYETGNDMFYVSMLAQERLFWQWWCGVVEERARQFVAEFADSAISSRELFYIWDAMLDARSLAVLPADKSWSNGYANLIGDLIRSKQACELIIDN